MLEAVHTDLVFTVGLKRSTHIHQPSTRRPAGYPIFPPNSDQNADAALFVGLVPIGDIVSYSITSSAR